MPRRANETAKRTDRAGVERWRERKSRERERQVKRVEKKGEKEGERRIN